MKYNKKGLWDLEDKVFREFPITKRVLRSIQATVLAGSLACLASGCAGRNVQNYNHPQREKPRTEQRTLIPERGYVVVTGRPAYSERIARDDAVRQATSEISKKTGRNFVSGVKCIEFYVERTNAPRGTAYQVTAKCINPYEK